ncbi:DUF1643 domain-containing protein [Streptosporangium sp. NPDC003464]
MSSPQAKEPKGADRGEWARRRTLCAVLLNPALKPLDDTITYRNVCSILPLVGCDRIAVANLINVPTKDAAALNRATIRDSEVEEAQAALAITLERADEVIIAWGVGGMSGPVRLSLQRQARWLFDVLNQVGIERVWTVTAKPRHPSRWRQYVGPEKGRVPGDCFEERLSQVLVPTLLDTQEGRILFDYAF